VSLLFVIVAPLFPFAALALRIMAVFFMSAALQLAVVLAIRALAKVDIVDVSAAMTELITIRTIVCHISPSPSRALG
jgi:hypothetical protein